MTQTTYGGNGADQYTKAEANAENEAAHGLEDGDKDKIDRTLEELNVSTTESGQDKSQDEDTEGSNSSSKNLDKQGD